MPIWLRNFTFNSIKEFHEEQGKQEKPPESNSPKTYGPNIQPSYSTKASN